MFQSKLDAIISSIIGLMVILSGIHYSKKPKVLTRYIKQCFFGLISESTSEKIAVYIFAPFLIFVGLVVLILGLLDLFG